MEHIFFRIRLVHFLFFYLLTIFLQAQKPDYEEVVTVIGTYEPQLIQAKKIFFTPEIKDTIIKVQDIKYTILSYPLDFEYTVKPIAAAKMIGEPFEKLYKSYIKAGFGNYLTPYAELFYHSERNKNLRAFLNLKHLSSYGKIKNYGYPAYSDNKIKIAGSYLFSNYSLWSSLSYRRDALHYYGFTPGKIENLDNKSYKQVFNLFDVNFDAESKYTNENLLHHSIKLKYEGLIDKFETKENNIFLDFHMKKKYSLFGFLEDEAIHTHVDLGYFIIDTNHTHSHFHSGIETFLHFAMDDLELTPGIILFLHPDIENTTFFYPSIRLDINLVPEHFKTFIGYGADVECFTIRSLYEKNPFINTKVTHHSIMFSKNKLYGGVLGGFGGNFSYRLEALNRKNLNMPLFINDTIPFNIGDTFAIKENRFIIIYDDVDILSFLGDLRINVAKKVEVAMTAAYHIYSPQKEDKAWHLPSYDGSLEIGYNIRDKIYTKFILFAFGNRYAKKNNEPFEKLNPIFDFNLGLEYRYSKLLSAFVQLNNITAQRYYYWYKYPSQRLNLMIGASYSF